MAIPYGNDARIQKQAYRNVMKEWRATCDDNAIYVLLGLEDQTKVHYAMPVKNGVYDFLNYAQQVEEARKSYRKNNSSVPSLTPAEYLSGFRKTDHLLPVITVVIYFGADQWDGPLSLHEMFTETDPNLLRFIPDYRINLISPAQIAPEDFSKFTTEFAQVMEYIKYSKDREKLQNAVSDESRYSSIDRSTFELINVLTNSTIVAKEKEGKIDMCQAIADMKKEAMQQKDVANIKSLQETLGLNVKQAMDALKISPDDQIKYTELLAAQ